MQMTARKNASASAHLLQFDMQQLSSKAVSNSAFMTDLHFPPSTLPLGQQQPACRISLIWLFTLLNTAALRAADYGKVAIRDAQCPCWLDT